MLQFIEQVVGHHCKSEILTAHKHKLGHSAVGAKFDEAIERERKRQRDRDRDRERAEED